MVEHFRKMVDQIEGHLQENFPHRADILRAAFNAHKRDEFVLSIPVMLAQADGIGEEIFGAGISPSSTGKEVMKKRKRFVDENVDSSLKTTLPTYCLAVSSVLPINANRDDRSSFTSLLNRHMVLHGLSMDYATEENALKTVSWLEYVSSFRSFAVHNKTSATARHA
jgi:hypothetical protein